MPPVIFFVGACAARGIIYSHPRRALHDTPPPEPPTQTMFARGPVVAVGILVWYRSGTLLSITVTTPSRKARHPSAEGNVIPRRNVPSSPPLEGWAQPGVVREFKNTHLIPILCHSRAGGNRAVIVTSYLIRENNSVLWFYLSKIRNTNLIDPIPAYAGMTKCLLCGGRGNDKGVRANARRHIVLDCHSRTPTFSTLIVLLRNDRELCADSIYTLNSTLYTLSIPRHGAELTQMSLALL